MDELEESRNPFALVVLAHLRYQETKNKAKVRKLWKVSLVKSLDEKGYTGDDREALYCFIDWLLALPEDLETEYNEEMKRYEEEKDMAYVTTAERIGIKKGFSQGKEQGMVQGIEKGMEKGMEKGKELQKHEDARAMDAEGIARPVIARVLKITEEELVVILGEGEK